MRSLALPGPSLNRLDLVLLLMLAFAVLGGWRRGFVSVVLGYVGYVVALVLAARYSGPLGKVLEEQFGLASRLSESLGQRVGGDPGGVTGQVAGALGERLLGALAFLGLMFILSVLLGWLSNFLGGMANAIPLVGTANRLLGAALSLAIWSFFLAIFLIVLSPLVTWLGGPAAELWSSSRVAWTLLRVYGEFATLLLGRVGPVV